MTLAPSRHYRPMEKPRVRRVRWPLDGTWVWGLYHTRFSPRPFMMAPTVARLTEMLGCEEERRLVNLMERLSAQNPAYK